MSQIVSHPVFDGFLTLWVYNPKKQFPLRYKELLVYSVLAHADARAWKPYNTDLAWRTGLNRNSIPGIIKNLQGEGLVLEDRTPVHRPEYFLSADRKKPVEHWSQELRFWKCLIRCQSSKVRVTDQCVLSYVWWSQVTGFEPPNGWSVPYLAHILKLGKKTVREAIARLQKMCLLRITGNQWAVPDDLKPLQEEWFIRKSEEFTAKEKVTLGTFEPDLRELADGYLPGDIIGVGDPVKSRHPVDLIAVYGRIGHILKGHECSTATRNRLFEKAKPDLEAVGTDGDDWKPIVDRHVQMYLAQKEESGGVSDDPQAIVEMSDEELLRELQVADLV